jgi:glycosyltransferase involved in cell wall biosynthesis
MDITIIIPHYAVGSMCAYSIAQILKYKGEHNVQIVVIDNNSKDGSAKYLEPFMNDITYATYPTDKLQSHGIAINWAIENGLVINDYFITLENDSFPIKDGFLDYYKWIVNEGYDIAGSVLKLSGGTYLHGCGTLYNKGVIKEANNFIKTIPYTYFPNMAMKFGFQSHLMIHNNILDEVLNNPDDWVELADGYKGLLKKQMLDRAEYYSATNNAFHCGMGGSQEDVNTYGLRCAKSDVPEILIKNGRKIIFRVGYEPMQFLYYFALANGNKILEIPIEQKWMPNREGQQQEYTLNEAGIKHLWAISSYTERGSKDVEDIYEAKRKIPEELYNSLPNNQKIK